MKNLQQQELQGIMIYQKMIHSGRIIREKVEQGAMNPAEALGASIHF